ncbi:MAG: hypothetical protein ABIQ18_32960 [Umezawaea sp.]
MQRPAPSPEGARPGPEADPKFAALKSDLAAKQNVLGKAANAEQMNAAKPGEFDKAAFVRAVNAAIAAQAPKNLDEAAKFGDSGKADAVKRQVQGQVSAGKRTRT